MENHGNPENDMKNLNIEELDEIAGGEDYAYAKPILSKIVARFHELIDAGVAPDAARAQVKNEYWGEVLQVCSMYPEEKWSTEQQAEVIFSLVIGI